MFVQWKRAYKHIFVFLNERIKYYLIVIKGPICLYILELQNNREVTINIFDYRFRIESYLFFPHSGHFLYKILMKIL